MRINLQKHVQLWCEHSIISESDAQKILAFENSHYNRSWVSFGIAGIGVTAIVAGFLSVIASNWEIFGDTTKLGGYFLLQVVAGAVFLKHEQKKGLVREISLAIFALLFWAGIGLFGQVYNLSGTSWQTMLFWVFLALPATIYSNSRMLCSFWCVTVLATAIVWCIESSKGNLSHTDELSYYAVVLTTATLLAAFGLGAHMFRLRQAPLRNASITWGLGFLLLIGTTLADWKISLLIDEHWQVGPEGNFPLLGNVRSLLPTWAAFGVAVVASLNRPQVPSRVRKATAALLVAIALYISMPFILPLSAMLLPEAREILGAAAFIAVWGIAAVAAATASMKRLFEVASFVIATRFIAVYFQVFGTLSTTGIGLIISGGVIIGVAILWNRGRRAISSKFGGEA